MEYIIAVFWAITGVCGVGLMIVYWTGGQAQYEGALAGRRLRQPGIGLLLWARYLLPGHDITASRGHHVSDAEERAAIVESLRGHRRHDGPRGFLVKKVLVPMGGIFGLAAIGRSPPSAAAPGAALYHTKWYRGARLVTEDGRAVRVSTTSWSTGYSPSSPRAT